MLKRFISLGLTSFVLAGGLLVSAQTNAEPVLAAHSDIQATTALRAPIDFQAEKAAANTPNAQNNVANPTPLVVPPIKTIVIDPGHGGTNEGAIGIAGIHEKHLTLKLALLLADRLKTKYPDINVILTRESDQTLSLNDRIAIANAAHADLFLSLHFNSSMNPLAIGFESFWAGEFLEQESKKLGDSQDVIDQKRHAEPYSQLMAECFNHAMSKRFDVLDRGVKPGDYTVLTRAQVPAVVLEFAFLSHAQEGLDVVKPEHQAKMIDALVEAISRYQKGRE